MKDTLFSSILRFNAKGILREFPKPVVMGILNATPDSFYGSSRVENAEAGFKKAEKMIQDGASIIDIGGYSSRPGATDISEKEEIERVCPLIEAIKTHFPSILISIDTFRAGVAEKAVLAGADLINDISGGQLDPDIFQVAATHQCPYIMMHMRGTPQNMMENTNYINLFNDLVIYFSERIERAKAAGIKDLIIDLGFGFSKTREQNFELMRQLNLFQVFKLPILLGVSRKSMLYKTLNITPEESLNATTVMHAFALTNGAQILRVHDVKEAVEAVELLSLIDSSHSTQKREN